VGPKSQNARGGGTARLADGSKGAADGASWIGRWTERGGRWEQGEAVDVDGRWAVGPRGKEGEEGHAEGKERGNGLLASFP
jgi:hypothetical protein